MEKIEKIKVQRKILVILLVILLIYIVKIIYFNIKIIIIEKQNLAITEDMRLLYELQKNFDKNGDANFVSGEEEIKINKGHKYCLVETRHFRIYTHSYLICEKFAKIVEEIFEKIRLDLPFLGAHLTSQDKKINIYIFKDESEYRYKIRQPMWSTARVIYAKNSFYSYEQAPLKGVFPHEITHLLFYNFMEKKYDPLTMRWLSEGLAVYEEAKQYRGFIDKNLKRNIEDIKQGKYFHILDFFKAEILETKNKEKILLWYAQAWSISSFLIDEISRDKFYEFCIYLRKTGNIKQAFFNIYKGIFNSPKELEEKWLKFVNKQQNT